MSLAPYDIFWTLACAVVVALAIAGVVHVVRVIPRDRESARLGWSLVSVLLPVVGPIITLTVLRRRPSGES